MESGDGWLARVRTPGGVIGSDQLRAVADASILAGSGLVDITSRANLQLRGCRGDELDELAVRLTAAGLSSGDAVTDQAKAVVDSPFAEPGRWERFSDAIRAGVSMAAGVGGLPAKFSVVINLDPDWPMHDLDADAVVGPDGVVLRRSAGRVATDGSLDTARQVVASIASWCARTGERSDLLPADVAERSALDVRAADPVRAVEHVGVHDSPPPIVLGVARRETAFVTAPLLGRCDGAALRRVADLADEHRALIRLTNQRSVAFLSGDDKAMGFGALGHQLAALGWLTERNAPVANVSACVGSAGCSAGRIDTSRFAHVVASTHGGGRVHISACEKGCGAPRTVPHLIADQLGNVSHEASKGVAS